MSRIEATFAALAARKQKALCAYLCVGDPSLAESVELAVAAVEAGADLLELGVPFSDPTADGPVIARAAQRAIHAGATILGVLDAAAAIRARTDVPLVLFTYYNPVLTVGEAEVIERARRAGIDALLVVDLPPEEGAELRALAARAGLAFVPLVAPTSDDARAEAIVAGARSAGGPTGFLYYVSMTGVTGAGSADFAAARAHAGALRVRFGWPVLVGFGIDGPETARAASGASGDGSGSPEPESVAGGLGGRAPHRDGPDGVVVGTAIVRAIESASTPDARLASVRELIARLRGGLAASAR